MSVEQSFNLDLVPQKNPPRVKVTEYDQGTDGWLIRAYLFKDGERWEPPAGATVTVEGTTYENTVFRANGVINYGANPSVTFTLEEDMTGYKGLVWAKVVFAIGNSKIATSGFWIDCDRAGAEAGAIISARGFYGEIKTAVDSYLEAEHIVIDNTLSHEGSAAEASETGRRITAIERGELTQVDDITFVPGFVRIAGTVNRVSENYYFSNVLAYKGGDVYFRVASQKNPFEFQIVAFFDASKNFIGGLSSIYGSDSAVWDAYYDGTDILVSSTTGEVVVGELEGVLSKSQIRTWFPSAAYVAVSSLAPTNIWLQPQIQQWRGALSEQRYVVDMFGFNVQAAFDRINVVTYGAKGDGATDDSQAFAAAIDALGEGDTLYVPAGVYRVSAVNLKSHMTICGDGYSSVIQLMPGLTGFTLNQNCLNVFECEDVTIRDLKLDGLRTSQRASSAAEDQRLNGIWIRNSSHVLIDRVWLYNNGYHGTHITYSSYVTARNVLSTYNGFRPYHAHTKCYDITIVGMTTYNNGLGLSGGSGNLNDAIFFFGVQRLNITGCTVRANRRGCISIAGDGAEMSGADAMETRDVVISGCVCECLQNVDGQKVNDDLSYYPSFGIDIQGDAIKNVSVSGCTVRNAFYGVFVHGLERVDGNVAISGLSVSDCTYGAYLHDASRVTLVACRFRDSVKNDIYALLCDDLILDAIGTYSTRSGGEASIDIDSVEGCTISNARLALNGCHTHGIRLHGAPVSDKVLIIGAVIDDAVTEPLVLTGNSKTVCSFIDGVYRAEVSV